MVIGEDDDEEDKESKIYFNIIEICLVSNKKST